MIAFSCFINCEGQIKSQDSVHRLLKRERERRAKAESNRGPSAYQLLCVAGRFTFLCLEGKFTLLCVASRFTLLCVQASSHYYVCRQVHTIICCRRSLCYVLQRFTLVCVAGKFTLLCVAEVHTVMRAGKFTLVCVAGKFTLVCVQASSHYYVLRRFTL